MIRKSDGLRIVGADRSEMIEDGGLWVVAHTKTEWPKGQRSLNPVPWADLDGPKDSRGRPLPDRRKLVGETILIAVDITNLLATYLPASDIEFEPGDMEFEPGDMEFDPL